MARVYLKPDDKVEALCSLAYGEDGEFHEPELIDSTDLRFFREDEDPEDEGEWFCLHYDFTGSRASNPQWGRLYFDEDQPGY